MFEINKSMLLNVNNGKLSSNCNVKLESRQLIFHSERPNRLLQDGLALLILWLHQITFLH